MCEPLTVTLMLIIVTLIGIIVAHSTKIQFNPRITALGYIVCYLVTARIAIQIAADVGRKLFPAGDEISSFSLGAIVTIVTAIILLAFQKATRK